MTPIAKSEKTVVPERLPRVHVGQMYLDKWDGNTRKRIP